MHFQSYKAFSDKSGIFPDLASTTSLMLGRGSISSTEAPSAADEGELGKFKIVSLSLIFGGARYGNSYFGFHSTYHVIYDLNTNACLIQSKREVMFSPRVLPV